MNPELITGTINMISITAIVILMIYYSIINKKTDIEFNKIRTNKTKTSSMKIKANPNNLH